MHVNSEEVVKMSQIIVKYITFCMGFFILAILYTLALYRLITLSICYIYLMYIK